MFALLALSGCKKDEIVITEYKIKYETDGNGAITGEATQTVVEGKDCSAVTAIPNAGYRFVEWSDGIETPERQDKNITADKTVTAQFERINYTLSYAAGEGGYLIGTSNQTVNYGESGESVTAIPNVGYRFVSWSDGITTPERLDKNITADKTVTAQFERLNYTLSYAAGEGGYLIGTSNQTVNYGESGESVTAIPNVGYRFVSWSDGITTPERLDKNITADKTVTAQFERLNYTLSYAAGEGGYLIGTTNQTVSYGESGESVTAVPNVGYRFVSWSDGIETPERQDTNIIADKTVTAQFERINYTLSYAAGEGGYLIGTTNQTVSYGESGESVTAVPYEGFQFVSWSDGIETPERQDKNITADKSVTAQFEKITYSVRYQTDGNGRIEGKNNQTVSYNESGESVTAIPNVGYKFVQWSDGITNSSRSDLDIKSDLLVVAKFEFLFAGIDRNNWFLIETYQHLQNMYYYPTLNYQLNNNLDLRGINHEPIFDANNWFCGRFNGAGYTINNLTVNTENNYPSLFGLVLNGIISNLNLNNVDIKAFNFNPKIEGVNYYVGTIAGMFSGYLDCINVNGKIVSDGFDYDYVTIGGLVGLCHGTIADCDSDIQIEIANANSENSTGNPYVFGGLVGVSDSAYVRDCSVIGNITVTNSCNYILVGGLIGYYILNSDRSTYIRNCETDIEITGDSYYSAGGFVGQIYCYTNSSLQILNNAVHGDIIIGTAAGFINRVSAAGEELIVEDCYTDNNVTGFKKAVGFISYFISEQNSISLIKHCYVAGNVSAHLRNDEGQFTGDAVGFCYQISGVSICNCYVASTLLGQYTVGFVRMIVRSQISNCFTAGSIYSQSRGSVFLYSIADSLVVNCYSTCNEIAVKGFNGNHIFGFALYVRDTNLSNYYYAGNSLNYLINIVYGESEIVNCHVLGERKLINDNQSTAEMLIGITVYENIEDMYYLADKLNEGQDEKNWVNVENALPKLKFEIR